MAEDVVTDSMMVRSLTSRSRRYGFAAESFALMCNILAARAA